MSINIEELVVAKELRVPVPLLVGLNVGGVQKSYETRPEYGLQFYNTDSLHVVQSQPSADEGGGRDSMAWGTESMRYRD